MDISTSTSIVSLTRLSLLLVQQRTRIEQQHALIRKEIFTKQRSSNMFSSRLPLMNCRTLDSFYLSNTILLAIPLKPSTLPQTQCRHPSRIASGKTQRPKVFLS
jgi:hypothetical protein